MVRSTLGSDQGLFVIAFFNLWQHREEANQPTVYSSCLNVQREKRITCWNKKKKRGEGGKKVKTGNKSEQSFHWNTGGECNELERGMFAKFTKT